MTNQRPPKRNPGDREFPAGFVFAVNLERTLTSLDLTTSRQTPTVSKCSIASLRQDGKLTSRRQHRIETTSTDTLSYSTIFKKNYAFLGAVFATGFAFEMGFNSTMNKIWDANNRGRQWKDIRHKFIGEAEDEE